MMVVPSGSVVVLMVAAPDESVAVPNVMDDPKKVEPGMVNVTCPVGAAKPADPLPALTLAVSVTAWPKTAVDGDALTVIVTVPFTVCTRLA
jgi:hypothetical protein